MIENQKDKSGFDKIKAQMTSFYDKTAESAKNTFVSLNTKIKESHIGDDIKKFGTKVADKSKEYGVQKLNFINYIYFSSLTGNCK